MTAWNKVMTADRFGLAKGFVRNRVSRGAVHYPRRKRNKMRTSVVEIRQAIFTTP